MKVLIKLPKTVTEDTSLAKTKYAVMKVSDFGYSLMLNDHTPIGNLHLHVIKINIIQYWLIL